MKFSFISKNRILPDRRTGFSLIEVVLAIGIFLVTVLALVGLLGPTLQSVDEVEKTDEIASIVNTVNAFLQSSPNIAAATGSKFDAIYNAVAANNYAELFVFRAYRDTSTDVELKVGFNAGEGVGSKSTLASSDFSKAAGPIYRVILTPSSVIPLLYHHKSDADDPTKPGRDSSTSSYQLSSTYKNDVTLYLEGYFAMEVRIFARDIDMAAVNGTLPSVSLANLAVEEPVFTYNTAVVR